MSKMQPFKFATRKFSGEPARYYSVTAQDLSTGAPTKPRVGHHIVVVDCSGSMYGDIDDVKEKLRKMLTLDEYRDSAMLVSLLSYASSGDLVEHFARVPVADIVKSRNTKAQREIGSLRARGMTCMTQALEAACNLVDNCGKGELTAVSLHTDGFFNDPSPTAEFKRIDDLIARFKKMPDVFVNTIGYRDWCDFKILDKIANSLSGKCWRATGIKEFYDSIYDTTQILAGRAAPALYLEKTGAFDYHVFVSSGGAGSGKIVGGSGDLNIVGAEASATRAVYRFKEISKKDFGKDAPQTLAWEQWVAVYALARAALAEGRINQAKYALAATRDEQLLDRHARALTGAQLAAFGADLDDRVLQSQHGIAVRESYALSQGATVPQILGVLAEHRDDFVLDMDAFASAYHRRGLKRLTGTWVDKKFVKPGVRTELRDRDPMTRVASFDFNRANATINMLVMRPCRLVVVDGGKEVEESGGIKLDLKDYKQYTLVADGDVNVESLRVRVTNKRLHRRLVEVGVECPAYDPETAFVIKLSDRPLVDYGSSFSPESYAGLADRLALLHAADKLLGALVKDKTSELSKEQVLGLAQLYVTPKLYFSPPSAVPYTDLKQALDLGEVDARLSYSITVGDREILDPSDLHSGNEFLRRWYEVSSKKLGEKDKPTMANRFDQGFKVEHKKLSSRVKVTVEDRVMARVFDEFFGLADTGLFAEILGKDSADKLLKVAGKKRVSGDASVEVLEDARAAVADKLNEVYQQHVSPLAFFIGSSGLLPDEFGDLAALTADQLVAKYPALSPSKSLRDSGVFYDLGNGAIITVVIESTYFSTPKGVAAADAVERAASCAKLGAAR